MNNASLKKFAFAPALASAPTPFHVYFSDYLKEDAKALQAGIREYLPDAVFSYSVKTNPLVRLLKDVHSLGWEMQALTDADLQTALRAGVAPKAITLGGSAWTETSLASALLAAGVRKVVVDSANQAKLLENFLIKHSLKLDQLFLRVNDRNSHFGFAREEVVDCLKNLPASLSAAFGLHLHVNPAGSPQSAVEIGIDFSNRAATLLEVIRDLRAHSSAPRISLLNLGGGIDSPYVYRPHPQDFARFHNPNEVAEYRKQHLGRSRFTLLAAGQEVGKGVAMRIREENIQIIFEPGRAACTRALSTVLSIRAVKDSLYPDAKIYISDGNTALLGPAHRAVHAVITEAEGKTHDSFIYGNLPHSGDWLFQNIALPELNSGDRILVEHTGAYFLSCEANFSEPRPGIYDAATGSVIRKPESPATLSERDIL